MKKNCNNQKSITECTACVSNHACVFCRENNYTIGEPYCVPGGWSGPSNNNNPCADWAWAQCKSKLLLSAHSLLHSLSHTPRDSLYLSLVILILVYAFWNNEYCLISKTTSHWTLGHHRYWMRCCCYLRPSFHSHPLLVVPLQVFSFILSETIRLTLNWNRRRGGAYKSSSEAHEDVSYMGTLSFYFVIVLLLGVVLIRNLL